MKRKCLLFAYGLLQPGYSPPRSMSQSWPDRIRGQMYDLGAYPAAVQITHASTWIEGHTVEIDVDELPMLDEFEDVGGGEFSRRLVETEQGHTAWVYEYQRPVPAVLAPITKWTKT